MTLLRYYHQYFIDPSCYFMPTHIQLGIWKKVRVGKWGWITKDFIWKSFISVNVLALFHYIMLFITFLIDLRIGRVAGILLKNFSWCKNHHFLVMAAETWHTIILIFTLMEPFFVFDSLPLRWSVHEHRNRAYQS